MQDWLTKSACDLGRGIAAGQICPVALTQTYLDAIDGHDASGLIYARLTRDRALAEAAGAKARADTGQRLSALDGVPISWKDLFDTAGTATEAGTALLKDRTPTRDAEVLRNATAAGLVCLGKTHMTELAFSGLGLNPVTATPPCINDADAVPGGSSSGAAASVAFGLAAAGIGSDTGGSVRIPSAWNDLVGLKTSVGRLPVVGVVPLAAKFDTVGPLCRSVEDAAALLSIMGGGAVADLRGASLDGMRLGVLRDVAFDDIRDGSLAGFDRAIDRLRAAGAIIQDLHFPRMADAMDLSGVLFAGEAYAQWGDLIEADPDVMFDEILTRFRSGRDVTARDYIKACRTLDDIRSDWLAAQAGFDAVIVPTSPIMPPDRDRLLTDSAYFTTENLLALRNTRIGNLMGSAGLTLPTGVPSAGITFMGPPGSEEKLLRLGAAAERAIP